MKCPDFEKLLDHLDGRLDPEESAGVESHVNSGCRQCIEGRQWYETVRATAADDDTVAPPQWVFKRALRIFDRPHSAPTPLLERLGRTVASLIFDSFGQAAVAGIRSTDTVNRQLLYHAGDYHIDLQIAPVGQGRADLMGQVLLDGEAGFDSVAGLPVALIQDGVAIRTAATDSLGQFSLDGLESGAYELRIDTAEDRVTVPGLTVSAGG